MALIYRDGKFYERIEVGLGPYYKTEFRWEEIKNMKFTAEDRSQWEIHGDIYKNWKDEIVAFIKRIPEKSELQKHCEERLMNTLETDFYRYGFEKAIEVLEHACPYRMRGLPAPYSKEIEILKKWAGVK